MKGCRTILLARAVEIDCARVESWKLIALERLDMNGRRQLVVVDRQGWKQLEGIYISKSNQER